VAPFTFAASGLLIGAAFVDARWGAQGALAAIAALAIAVVAIEQQLESRKA
jgi:hypothetical protein